MEKQYYITKEQYESLKAAWATHSMHDAKMHIIYNILRSKPAKHGFTEKTKHIQGNDPWYGFNVAKKDALWSISTKNPFSPTSATGIRYAEQLVERKAAFKKYFGIDMPEDLNEQITAETAGA